MPSIDLEEVTSILPGELSFLGLSQNDYTSSYAIIDAYHFTRVSMPIIEKRTERERQVKEKANQKLDIKNRPSI